MGDFTQPPKVRPLDKRPPANVPGTCPSGSGARARRTSVGSPVLPWLIKADEFSYTADLCQDYASRREYTALWLSAAGAC